MSDEVGRRAHRPASQEEIVAAIGSIAAVPGGIVSLGSNVTTLRETMAAMNAADALRSDLIGSIDLRVIECRAMKRI